MFVDLTRQIERAKRELLSTPKTADNLHLITSAAITSAFASIGSSLEMAERQIFESLGNKS